MQKEQHACYQKQKHTDKHVIKMQKKERKINNQTIEKVDRVKISLHSWSLKMLIQSNSIVKLNTKIQIRKTQNMITKQKVEES